MAEGVRRHLGDLASRVPGAVPVLQVDEPALPAALVGAQPTRSGWGRLAPLDQAWAEQMLGEVLAASPDREARIVHCCGHDVPVGLVMSAGAGALSFDLDLVGDADLEAYAEAVDAGAAMIVGAIPTTPGMTSAAAADRVRQLWSRLGFAAAAMRARTTVSPACGLAGVLDEQARATYRTAREAALRLSEHDGIAPGR